MAASDSPVNVVVGSNDGDTLKDHVAALATRLGLPRRNARLGVINYSGAFYHPKTYHVRRTDGTQAAYVGSANLTLAGVGSLHVEAGIVLDTRDGDPASVLNEISVAVDDWFACARPGLEMVRDLNDVETLASAGVLALAPAPRAPSTAGASGGSAGPGTRPRLSPLLRFPPVLSPAPAAPTPPIVAPTAFSAVAVPQAPYPPYVLFAPGVTAPTVGAAALNGAALPGGASGLVIRLNRDSSRHWHGRDGTANISVPVPTVSTFRFGVYRSRYERPRVEFPIETRFLTNTGEARATRSETNVMVYGFAAGESGHGDVRLLVPRLRTHWS